ncbi:MAG: prepilin-type N-terminal cleavage/methylation domain-containing protein, partial [Oscillospiraceae bacterium]|nr:prepilin-type N-terminal cleavage/methylation domain-containing protein [Oscillospiraceae bacterium]
MKKFKERMAAREGFTLVELIVVIAILAILAAVAVPTYSGYIERANEAADIQTLSAINTAAVSAAAAQGLDLTDSNITFAGSITGSGSTVDTITLNYSGNTAIEATLQSDFATFMGESSYGTGISVSFEVYTSLSVD